MLAKKIDLFEMHLVRLGAEAREHVVLAILGSVLLLLDYGNIATNTPPRTTVFRIIIDYVRDLLP